MNTQIVPSGNDELKQANKARLVPKVIPSATVNYRLNKYLEWLAVNRLRWDQADLAAYRDYLQTDYQGRDGQPLALSTIAGHLATIRGRYNKLLTDNAVRDDMYAYTPADASPSDRKAFVDEMLVRLQNAVHPSTAKVKPETKQDIVDSEQIRLTKEQAAALMRAPGIDTLRGQRDTAMLALALGTGAREAELCDVEVKDLRQTKDGVLGLHIRDGKGKKTRIVPYGDNDWCLVFVERWLAAAGITDGPVFRGMYKGKNGKPRDTAITPRNFNRILDQYPVMIDGEMCRVKPHDLRRSYARLAYESGIGLQELRLNLGHADLKTTQIYIGDEDIARRKPRGMLDSPYVLADLARRWTLDD